MNTLGSGVFPLPVYSLLPYPLCPSFPTGLGLVLETGRGHKVSIPRLYGPSRAPQLTRAHQVPGPRGGAVCCIVGGAVEKVWVRGGDWEVRRVGFGRG